MPIPARIVGATANEKGTWDRLSSRATKCPREQATYYDTHAKFIEMISKAREVLDLSKTQLVRIDGVLVDATERARAQIERVDLIMDDTVSRVHQTFNTLHSGVMRPIREVQGIAAGLQAMFATLFGGSRPTVAEATHDEEMFI